MGKYFTAFRVLKTAFVLSTAMLFLASSGAGKYFDVTVDEYGGTLIAYQYTFENGGCPEICIISADGKYWKQLTRYELFDESPVFSPDGKQIVFERVISSYPYIFIVNADGSGLKRLTEDRTCDPSFSPDGKKIVFSSWNDGEINIMNADGTVRERLTHHQGAWGREWFGDGPYGCSLPRFSPGGKQIIYGFSYGLNVGADGLYIVNTDGSDQRRLAPESHLAVYPEFSPDDRKVLFIGLRKWDWEVAVINTDGSGRELLTRNEVVDMWPSFSPDGEKIVFSSAVGKRAGSGALRVNIYVMNADGSNLRQLTDTDECDNDPTFTPDGKQIIYREGPDACWDFYIMEADGSNRRRLTEGGYPIPIR